MTLRDSLIRASNNRYAQSSNLPLMVTPEQYSTILTECISTLSFGHDAIISKEMALKSMYGLSIVMVPFQADPLYKELQAMATLVGAELSYPDITYGQQQWKVDIAEFFKDGSGWRYINGNGTLNGESILFPINGPWPAGGNIQERTDVSLRSSR